MMKIFKRSSVCFISVLLSAGLCAQQGGRPKESPITIGVHIDPVISWFSSDTDSVRNDGARSGFNFGLTINKYFGPNYAFSTGINLISTGGRLESNKTTDFELSDNPDLPITVNRNDAIVYKIQYLAFPIGLKLQTNQIGYITYFTDLGLDPKIAVGRSVDIPANDIENEKATGEINLFNISYHIIAGIEYAIGGNTSIVLGLGFDNNFADLTQDNRDQFIDKISHKMISLRLGVNF
jgi:hypothetical protein